MVVKKGRRESKLKPDDDDESVLLVDGHQPLERKHAHNTLRNNKQQNAFADIRPVPCRVRRHHNLELALVLTTMKMMRNLKMMTIDLDP